MQYSEMDLQLLLFEQINLLKKVFKTEELNKQGRHFILSSGNKMATVTVIVNQSASSQF